MEHGEQEFINVDVVYMQYSADRDARQPDVRFDGSRLVGLADLHRLRMRTRAQRRLTDPLVYKHSNWYNEILQEELAEAPTGYQLQVFHWSIESGVRQAFAATERGSGGGGSGGSGDHHGCNPPPLWLDAVSMIIGPSMEYRFGVSKHPQLGGARCSRFARRSAANAVAGGAGGGGDNDQYRQLLPRCPRVLDACNGCSWYFHRGCCVGGGASAEADVGGGGYGGAGGGDSCEDSCEESDGGGDGGVEDALFFRITMRKFRRTKQTTYNATTGRQIRMNVRQAKTRLCTIAES